MVAVFQMSNTCQVGELLAQRVTPSQYFGDPAMWERLRAAAGADPLFMSAVWQQNWWNCFGALSGLEPYFIEVSTGGSVVGRAGFVRHEVRQLGRSWCRMEVLGNLWHGPATMRSEYLDVIAVPEIRSHVVRAIARVLRKEATWDEMVFVDIEGDSDIVWHVCESGARKLFARPVSQETSYEIHIEGTFQSFVSELSVGARRRHFGQRRRLEARGPLALEDHPYADASARAELDRLHALRWGAPLLHGGRDEFFSAIAAQLPHGALSISLLRSGGRAISALLQVRLGEREYNLQGGFDAASATGVSPTRLHWGLLIERAYREGAPRIIDLLAGGGRQDNFKADFSRRGRAIATWHVIRNRPLALACRAQDAIRGRTWRST